MKVQIPVVFTKPVFRSDLSVRLEFETREFSGSEAAALMEQRNKEGWLIFSPRDDLTEADIPDEKPDAMLGTKTPAKRLRDRMFVYYSERKIGDKNSFNNWYETELERIGEKYLEKLEA